VKKKKFNLFVFLSKKIKWNILFFKENHSGEAALAYTAKKITVTHSHLKEKAANKPFIPLSQHQIENESCNDENNLLEDDDEDFFNEKSNKIVHVSCLNYYLNFLGTILACKKNMAIASTASMSFFLILN